MKMIFIKRFRHRYLTFRQMLFVNNLILCFFNKTKAAIIAGYSPVSARWTAYRIWNLLQVQIYYVWQLERVSFDGRFPHADFLLPDADELKYRLARADIKVKAKDIRKAEMKPAKIHFGCLSNGNHDLKKSLENGLKKHGIRE